jgi:hypothetical protein
VEKRGVVSPGITPDTEQKLKGEKTAAAGERGQTEQLDNDVTKRLADRAEQKLSNS